LNKEGSLTTWSQVHWSACRHVHQVSVHDEVSSPSLSLCSNTYYTTTSAQSLITLTPIHRSVKPKIPYTRFPVISP